MIVKDNLNNKYLLPINNNKLKSIITGEQRNLLESFFYLRSKLIHGWKLNYYDKKLIEILEEYDHYPEYSKEWSKRDYEEI